MLISEKISIKLFSKNINYYKNLGYECNIGDTIIVDVKELSKFSRLKVEVMCDNCKKIKNIKYSDYILSNKDNTYYCYNCKSIRMKKTNIKKYGVENVFQLESIKEKSKKTNLKKRGCEFATQCNETKNKKIITNRRIYGVDYATQSKEIMDKIKETCRKKYKNDYSFLNDNVKIKIKETLFQIYGENNPMKSEIIKKKASDTRIKNLFKKYEFLDIVDIKNNIYKFKCDCGEKHDFEISSILLYNRLKYKTKLCTVCNTINSYNNSGFQIDLTNFIKNNYDDTLILNDREIIKPNEIDIYLPDLNLGFEFDGLYWHNELYKSLHYHLNKTEDCEKLGIKLIHIYEDDWLHKQDIVKSRILNLLGKSEKIMARKCIIKEINDNKLVREFLEQNHLQGFVGSKYKIGLFYQDELVSLMAFGSQRKAMGQKSKEGSYEMLRFCNKLNVNVVGGASRLFKYFIKKYEPNDVISYADRSWSSGDLYKNLGFELVHKTKPNYYYVVDGIRKHRFGFRKDVLIKNGADQNKTEHEIMLEKGIFRIYDSGHLKYIYI
jgi:hypothetical protein